jgi:SWI/SNF-related matrix-associated actin-dependent regulator 1 of chromatin subfamily A
MLMGVTANIHLSNQADASMTVTSVPAPKGQAYKPFQLAGIDHMVSQLRRGRRSLGLFDEQGNGKTVQAIGVANYFGMKKLLVICPASLRLNWAREIEKWHLHSNGVTPVITGKDLFHLDRSVVVSYNLATKVKEFEPDLIIVDESHYIKNSGTVRTQLILGNLKEKWPGLVAKAPTLFLSGTPLPNGKPNELWPLLFKCAPDCISNLNFWNFVRRFCRVEDDGDGGVIFRGAKKTTIPELFVRLRGSGFMTRRLKKDVLKDLPPKQYQMVVFPKDSKTAKVVRKEKEFNAHEIITHGVPVGSALPGLRREMGIAKLDQSVNFIKTLLDGGVDKLVVFAYHTEVNAELTKRLAGYGAVKITGSTPAALRQDHCDAFQSDPRVRVLVGNLQAAGTGFTLTAAHNVVFVEGSWVPGENDQCADRVHRIGQNERVTVFFLVVTGSLDARILSSAAGKATDVKGVLDNEKA